MDAYRKPARMAHHRADNRCGPWASWRRKCAYRLSLMCAAVKALDALLACDLGDVPVAVKVVILKARVARDRAWPLVTDTDGSAWE